MPKVYHGTRRADAEAMAGSPGTIDVSRGAGEFGRGYYTQSSKSNALSWAENRYPPAQSPCLLVLDIDDQPYAGLDIKTLTLQQASRRTQRLRSRGTTATHTEGVDVLVGPLNGQRRIQQQKFESNPSQTLLNGPDTQRRVE